MLREFQERFEMTTTVPSCFRYGSHINARCAANFRYFWASTVPSPTSVGRCLHWFTLAFTGCPKCYPYICGWKHVNIKTNDISLKMHSLDQWIGWNALKHCWNHQRDETWSGGLRVQYQMPQYCAKTAGDQEKNHLLGGKTLPKQGSQDFASWPTMLHTLVR